MNDIDIYFKKCCCYIFFFDNSFIRILFLILFNFTQTVDYWSTMNREDSVSTLLYRHNRNMQYITFWQRRAERAEFRLVPTQRTAYARSFRHHLRRILLLPWELWVLLLSLPVLRVRGRWLVVPPYGSQRNKYPTRLLKFLRNFLPTVRP